MRLQAVLIYPQIACFLGSAEIKPQIKQHVHLIFENTASKPKLAFLKILPEVIAPFRDDIKTNKGFFSDILKEFLNVIEVQIDSPSWRFIQGSLLFLIDNLSLFEKSEIVDLAVPVFFSAMVKGSYEVCREALDALLQCIRHSQNKVD